VRDKLGPFLWHFPPIMRFDAQRLEAFFRLLPRDTEEALALARRRDSRMTGRSRLSIDANRKLRHAIEIRHPSFATTEFVELLREHGIGFVVADSARKWPKMFHVATDFVYVRLHGDVAVYTSGYTGRAPASWARRTRAWDTSGCDVYGYFDNDVKVRAAFDALNLMQKLHLRWRPSDAACGEEPVAMREAGTRVARPTGVYVPRVTRDNPAWSSLSRADSE